MLLLKLIVIFNVIFFTELTSVGAAWIAGQDRSMCRTLRPSAGQAQQ